MTLRVLMSTHWFDPEGGAAGHPGVLARAIRDRGHDVHVVTGFPTYPRGRVFDGYRNSLYTREVVDGITVHRGAIYPSHDSRALHRAANYLSFATVGSMTALRTPKDLDVAFVYSSPATAAVPAMTYRAVHHVPMIVHVQDLWPDSVTASGFVGGHAGRRLESTLHRFSRAVYDRADYVAVSAPGMVEILRERGVPERKLTVLPNWADEEHFAPRPPSAQLAESLGLKAPVIIMYAGNFGELQDLDTVIDAAARLRHRPDVLLALVGSGVAESRLRASVSSRGLTNVRFVPPQPFENIAEVLALADAQLVPLKDVPVLRATLPSKLQANLAVGKPVIGMVSGDAAEVIERNGAGLTCQPGDAAGLARVIEMFADLTEDRRQALGVAARTAYMDQFSAAVIGDRLDNLLHAAVANRV